MPRSRSSERSSEGRRTRGLGSPTYGPGGPTSGGSWPNCGRSRCRGRHLDRALSNKPLAAPTRRKLGGRPPDRASLRGLRVRTGGEALERAVRAGAFLEQVMLGAVTDPDGKPIDVSAELRVRAASQLYAKELPDQATRRRSRSSPRLSPRATRNDRRADPRPGQRRRTAINPRLNPPEQVARIPMLDRLEHRCNARSSAHAGRRHRVLDRGGQ